MARVEGLSNVKIIAIAVNMARFTGIPPPDPTSMPKLTVQVRRGRIDNSATDKDGQFGANSKSANVALQNGSAPDSLSHGTLVEQPSPEVCSPPAYGLICSGGMAPMGYCGKRCEPERYLRRMRLTPNTARPAWPGNGGHASGTIHQR